MSTAMDASPPRRTSSRRSSAPARAARDRARKLEAVERARTEPIAIVGMGCRFPGGARSPEAFWRAAARAASTRSREVPAERWDVDAYYDPDPDAPGKMCTRWGGFLDRASTGSTPRFFGISPREAGGMDPQQRLLLEVAWEALGARRAIAPDRLAGTPHRRVRRASRRSDYCAPDPRARSRRASTPTSATGNAHSVAAGRLSYLLGLQGPSVAVDTACSSSLVAVHLACQSLRRGECRLALAGGVNLMLCPERASTLLQARA